ncbi:MAG: hypothetical protein AB7F96_17510 [Beijerinckiaceae bacterium]
MQNPKPPGTPPPHKLDGAQVIEWCYFATPFRTIALDGGKMIACHGAAICRYDGSDIVYCFTCSIDWDVIVDTDYASIEGAKTMMLGNFGIPAEAWTSA